MFLGKKEMRNVPLTEATGLIFPRITVVVTTISEAGKSNAAPYSWIAPVSFTPPMLYLGIQKRETLTIRNMRETEEFVVNIVTRDWAHKAVACEEKHADKIEKSGITLKESKKVLAPRIKEAKIILECKLVDIVKREKPDHYIVLGEIVHAEKDPKLKIEEIMMHHSGSKFVSPGKYFEVQRRK